MATQLGSCFLRPRLRDSSLSFYHSLQHVSRCCRSRRSARSPRSGELQAEPAPLLLRVLTAFPCFCRSSSSSS